MSSSNATHKLRLVDLSDENIAQAIHLLDGNADDMEGFDLRAWRRVKEMILGLADEPIAHEVPVRLVCDQVVTVLLGQELVEVRVIAVDSDPSTQVHGYRLDDPDASVWFWRVPVPFQAVLDRDHELMELVRHIEVIAEFELDGVFHRFFSSAKS